MKCAHKPPATAATKMLKTQATQRTQALLMPMLQAAASSSRAARSFRPSGISRNRNASATKRSIQPVAVQRPVYWGMPKTVREPRVSSSHCSATLWTMISQANEAIVKEASRRRSNGTPSTAPTAAAISPAASSAGMKGKCAWCSSQVSGMSGRVSRFSRGLSENQIEP